MDLPLTDRPSRYSTTKEKESSSQGGQEHKINYIYRLADGMLIQIGFNPEDYPNKDKERIYFIPEKVVTQQKSTKRSAEPGINAATVYKAAINLSPKRNFVKKDVEPLIKRRLVDKEKNLLTEVMPIEVTNCSEELGPGTSSDIDSTTDTLEKTFDDIYKLYDEGKYKEVSCAIKTVLSHYGTDIYAISKEIHPRNPQLFARKLYDSCKKDRLLPRHITQVKETLRKRSLPSIEPAKFFDNFDNLSIEDQLNLLKEAHNTNPKRCSLQKLIDALGINYYTGVGQISRTARPCEKYPKGSEDRLKQL